MKDLFYWEVRRVVERLSNKCPCDKCGKDRKCELAQEACENYLKWEDDCIKKLAEYETAEEEGRLVVPPCKVGDTLFCFSRRKIYPFKVRCIWIYEERVEIELLYAGDEENLKFWHITTSDQDIGDKLLFTKEEAEKALKEMEGK